MQGISWTGAFCWRPFFSSLLPLFNLSPLRPPVLHRHFCPIQAFIVVPMTTRGVANEIFLACTLGSQMSSSWIWLGISVGFITPQSLRAKNKKTKDWANAGHSYSLSLEMVVPAGSLFSDCCEAWLLEPLGGALSAKPQTMLKRTVHYQRRLGLK